jgi:hypothetical protein
VPIVKAALEAASELRNEARGATADA